ncbi:hypothetical protein JMA_41780 (plasmid) [Jeotgalibacillus malaysiensis]|uniref:Uncharacterized protein n=1 Tax=Jeotgalibacillus malaysiensis TaxID=1508404 RepID=A0A0B5ATE9_9BACL|nr:hypothetical protein [Jeotgalibacillus malaysiensis]AJD93495.1 hypothetical protein JMA_41780 [Jeotgalibacillus malaysiensis]
MNKDKWVLIGGGAVLGLGMIGSAVFLMSDVLDPKPKTEETASVVKEQSTSKNVKNDNGKQENQTIVTGYTKLITPVGYGEKEFPLEQSDTFKEQLLIEAEGGEVDNILKEMEKRIATHRFSEGKNLEIAGLYADATFAKGLVDKTPEEMRKLLPGGFKTPEMLAILPLYFPEEARRTLYKDVNSLTPLNPGPWKIKDYRMITNRVEADADEAYQDNGVAISMYNVMDGLHQIHVIELIRDQDPGVPVRAYVGEMTNGTLELYGYYVPDGITHYYQTVSFFEDIEEQYLKPNDEYQQEQIEKEIEDGNIPEEVWDEFLNPTQ